MNTKQQKRKRKKPLGKFPSLGEKVSERLSHESSQNTCPEFPRAPPPSIQSGHTSWWKIKTATTILTFSFSHVPSIYVEFSSTISKFSFPLAPSSASFQFLLMGFHCRKLLQQHGHIIPPRGASYHSPAPSPSPQQRPLSFLPRIPWFHPPPGYADDGLLNHNHIRLLQVAMIVLGCTFGFTMILCTMSIIRRRYYSRRHNHRRGGNTPILFYVNGDSPALDDDDGDGDDDGPIIDHPIWFIRTEGLQQSVIDSITAFTYRKDEGLIDGTECSVCLGEFQEDETLRLLPKCSHAFHIPCIDTWLRSHKNCPLCRAPVVHDASGGGGGGDGGSAEVRAAEPRATEPRATEPDLNLSGESQEMTNRQMENFDGGISRNHNLAESESSVVRIIGDDDDAGGSGETPENVFPVHEKVNCHSSIVIGSHEVEEEMQPMRRSISTDSCAGSIMFHDVVDLNSDQESLDTQLGDKINSSGKDIMKVDKQGGGSSTTICKLASIGRVLQKRPISFRSSFSSYNTKSLSSRHCRSQSSTLPL